MRQQTQSHLPSQAGSEARLGDIIVTIMRRLERLEESQNSIVQEMRRNDARLIEQLTDASAYSQTMFNQINYHLQNLAGPVPRHPPMPADVWSVGTTTDYENEIVRDDQSDAYPTDGEGYDHETDEDCASPTPSELEEIRQDRARSEAGIEDGNVGQTGKVVVETVEEDDEPRAHPKDPGVVLEVVEELVEAAVDQGRRQTYGVSGLAGGHGRAVTLNIAGDRIAEV